MILWMKTEEMAVGELLERLRTVTQSIVITSISLCSPSFVRSFSQIGLISCTASSLKAFSAVLIVQPFPLNFYGCWRAAGLWGGVACPRMKGGSPFSLISCLSVAWCFRCGSSQVF
ncbi:hypothetical protein EYF80_036284 [Liparis tanakae]|uniref:Uncharacterized protein n=1 Tax=Liparis tanakae TaxID=230148 RepID=A0A4Z2GJX8_9TELE|nr:hypothetical protein EYF80_036284 [Liparis tanakae]